MSDDGRDKIYADLWTKQSDLLWRLVAILPIVESAIIAGWYTLLKDEEPIFAAAAAFLGAAVMALYVVLLYRASQYLTHFLKASSFFEGLPSRL